MISYLFVAGALLSFSLRSNFHCNYKFNVSSFILYFFTVLFLLIFAGLRENVGFDFFSYKNIFYGYNDTPVEPLYNAIQFITRLTGSYTFHLFFVAGISFLIKVYFFNKIIDYKLQYIVLFFYFTSSFLMLEMGVIRQSIAASFVLGAIYFNATKKTSLFVLFSFLATLSHISALAIVGLVLLFNVISLSRVNVLLMLSCSFLLMNLTNLFSSEISAVLVGFGDKYAVYTQNFEPVGLTPGLFLKLLVFFVIYEVFNNRVKNDLAGLFVFIYFCGLCFFIAFNSVPILAARLTSYFKVVEVVVFILFLLQFRAGPSRFFVFCILSIFSFAQLIKFLNEEAVIKDYSHYSNFLFNVL
ncbi:EpsG family protein [Aeromonas sp. S16(2024)]|uniref:EpsG family protein n=1 Tax=Aeromonas sp. S16(2024) TaxID=3242889 RepID=UPI00352890DC